MESPQQTLTTDDQLARLTTAVEANAGFLEIVAALRNGQSASVDGAWGSACALVAAALQQHVPSCLFLICADEKRADDLTDDIGLFASVPIEHFPAWESNVGERLIYDEIYGDRLRILKLLHNSVNPVLIVTSIQSLLQPVPPREAVVENTRFVNVGESLVLDEFAAWMVQHGFHATSAVELPGEFARRGGLLDVFAPDWDQPVRI